MELQNTTKELEDMKKDIQSKINRLEAISKDIEEQDKAIKIVADSIDNSIGDIVEKDEFIKFFKKPYVIIPQNKNKILVAIPKFIKNFQVGWLFKETENYYIYQLDQYSSWLGDVPRDLLDEINFKEGIKAEIVDDKVFFEPSEKDNIKKSLGKHLTDFKENTARIVKGHEFDILADMIDNGNLPFKSRKIPESDLRESRCKIELRKYQTPAFEKFLETGNIGLFHPTGAGKSMIAMVCMDVIKGNKIVFVPTRTLVEQWNWYINKYLPHIKNEIEISTYQGFKNSNDKKYALVIYDECHKLPANTFSRLSVINTQYRVGLSASPHREDGREAYIFALTGFPIGLNWKDYMEETGRTYHPIHVHTVKGDASKIAKVWKLWDPKKKTLIFCDGIDLGKKIAGELGVPFIYGATENRMEIIENNKCIVASRVLDLGVSIKDLNHVIEVDFLFGSRQQELQRTGRLMHSNEKDVRHDIIFTEKELESYGKRLWALQEKGFTIKMEN